MSDIFNDKIKDYINSFKKIEPNLVLSIGIIKNNTKAQYVFSNQNSLNDDYSYDIGSITKVYTALVISYLISNKTLFLEDEIGKYLNLNIQTPTIKNLLTHSAYRPVMSLKFMIKNFLKLSYFKTNPYNNKTNDDLIKYLKRHSFNKEKEYFYSDVNYAALGNLIENVYNNDYYNVMNNFINSQLKLSNTKFSMDSSNKINSFHKRKLVSSFNWNKKDAFLSAGGLCSTLNDSLEFINYLMNSKEEYILNSLNPIKRILLKKYKLKIGYAWHIGENGNLYYHRGAVGCYRSIYMFNKKKNIGIVILSNCIGNQLYNVNKLGKEIYKLLK